MKRCSKCLQDKPIKAFNKRGNKLQGNCKECNSNYLKEHYKKNKKYYNIKRKKRVDENLKWLFNYKENLYCIKCGYKENVVALDFHHRNPDEKIDTISSGVRTQGWSKETLIKEIKKCDLLCANCHRVEHHSQVV